MGIRVEQSRRWVRGYLGGVAVVDTKRPMLFWEDGFPVPTYAIPDADVRAGVLQPAEDGAAGSPEVDAGPERSFFGPHGPTVTRYDVAAGGRTAHQAAWVRADPALAGHTVFSWGPGVFDKWMEEDTEVFGHPRDPYHRVDAIPSSRQVRVELDGELLAESDQPVLLFETNLPTRYYLPPEAVRSARLEATEHWTFCPYKGVASRYWDHPTVANVAWSYPQPDPAVAAIAGRIAFYDEFVDVTVDGERQVRPITAFSKARP